uniref:Uncharacterized protein n=1 Tax=Falco tinnunculus TaxID=100819 RepID=A0A8C4XLA8_FALTI
QWPLGSGRFSEKPGWSPPPLAAASICRIQGRSSRRWQKAPSEEAKEGEERQGRACTTVLCKGSGLVCSAELKEMPGGIRRRCVLRAAGLGCIPAPHPWAKGDEGVWATWAVLLGALTSPLACQDWGGWGAATHGLTPGSGLTLAAVMAALVRMCDQLSTIQHSPSRT